MNGWEQYKNYGRVWKLVLPAHKTTLKAERKETQSGLMKPWTNTDQSADRIDPIPIILQIMRIRQKRSSNWHNRIIRPKKHLP